MSVASRAGRVDDAVDRRLFRCVLDDQPTFLVPARYLRPAGAAPTELMLNPVSWRSWSGTTPGLAAPPHPNRFDGERQTLWIRDARAMALPFQVGDEYRAVLDGLSVGRYDASSLPPRMRSTLTIAEALVSPDHAETSRRAWLSAASAAHAQFASEGLAPIARLIHPYHLGALRRYLRYALRTGQLHLGDGQSARRYITHNEPVLRFFHEQLTSAVAEVVGEPIRPSYLYVASYQQGADLPRHTDREQCEFTISILLDYSPEPSRESGWPLYVDLPSSTVEVFQGIGDALLFRGRTLPHYRKQIPDQCTSTSVFFHYVPAGFTAPLD